jgi:hypothetical protein
MRLANQMEKAKIAHTEKHRWQNPEKIKAAKNLKAKKEHP